MAEAQCVMAGRGIVRAFSHTNATCRSVDIPMYSTVCQVHTVAYQV